MAFGVPSGAKTNVARIKRQPITLKLVSDDSLVSDFTVMSGKKEKARKRASAGLFAFLRSVLMAQRDLDRTWSILGRQSRYCAEVGGGDVVTGKTELHMIKGIEEIGANDKAVALPGPLCLYPL